MTAREVHRLTRSIMEEVYRDYGIVLTVGIYASNTSSDTYAKMKGTLLSKAAEYSEILELHGFYVDEEKRTVTFDLIIDFKSERKFEIRESLIEYMRKLHPDYDFVAILDSDFSD